MQNTEAGNATENYTKNTIPGIIPETKIIPGTNKPEKQETNEYRSFADIRQLSMDDQPFSKRLPQTMAQSMTVDDKELLFESPTLGKQKKTKF